MEAGGTKNNEEGGGLKLEEEGGTVPWWILFFAEIWSVGVCAFAPVLQSSVRFLGTRPHAHAHAR